MCISAAADRSEDRDCNAGYAIVLPEPTEFKQALGSGRSYILHRSLLVLGRAAYCDPA